MELALRCDWENQGRVNNYEKNRREPTLKDIEKIAKVLQTSPEWLAYEIGDAPSYLGISSIPEGKVPVIGWNLVKKWRESYDISSLVAGISAAGDAISRLQFISVPDKKNSKLYALRVQGDSMISAISGKASFLEKHIIIVDPESHPQNMDYVIALQKGSHEAIFKQYIVDGSSKYLRPLNPQYPLIQLDESIEICGVVIAHLDVLI